MRLIPSIINNVIIGPHGITDIIHAYKEDKIKELVNIYSTSVTFTVCSEVIHNTVNLSDMLFIICSCVHFSHDINTITINNIKINKLLITSLFVIILPLIGKELFYTYMVFFHVPLHYIKCWNFIKDELNILSILLLSTILIDYKLLWDSEIDSLPDNVWIIVKPLIIGHVIYNEIYIDNN